MGNIQKISQVLWNSNPSAENLEEPTPEIKKTSQRTRKKTAEVLFDRSIEVEARRDAVEMPLNWRVALLDDAEDHYPQIYPSFRSSDRAGWVLEKMARHHFYTGEEAKEYKRWLMHYVVKRTDRKRKVDRDQMNTYDPDVKASAKEWNLFNEAEEAKGKQRIEKNAELIHEQLNRDPEIKRQVLLRLYNYFFDHKTPKKLNKVSSSQASKAKKIVGRLVLGHSEKRSDKLAIAVYKRLQKEYKEELEKKRAKSIKKVKPRRAA